RVSNSRKPPRGTTTPASPLAIRRAATRSRRAGRRMLRAVNAEMQTTSNSTPPLTHATKALPRSSGVWRSVVLTVRWTLVLEVADSRDTTPTRGWSGDAAGRTCDWSGDAAGRACNWSGADITPTPDGSPVTAGLLAGA